MEELDVGNVSEEEPNAQTSQIEEWLSQASHDDLKVYPAYNQMLQRQMAKMRQEEGDRQKEETRQREEFSRLSNYFEALQRESPDRFVQELQNPEAARQYASVADWRSKQTGGSTLRQAAQQMLDGLGKRITEDERFQGVDWSQLKEENSTFEDLTLAIGNHFAQKAIQDERKQMEKDLDEKFKAFENELLSRLAGNESQPNPLPGAGEPIPEELTDAQVLEVFGRSDRNSTDPNITKRALEILGRL